MSTVRTSILVVGAFLSLSAMAVAAVETATPNQALANHTARGAVKFVDSSTLVIHQISPYSGHNMTFIMRPSTEREGDLKVGSTVTVRYENEPDHKVATVVEVDHAKVPPHTSPSH